MYLSVNEKIPCCYLMSELVRSMWRATEQAQKRQEKAFRKETATRRSCGTDTTSGNLGVPAAALLLNSWRASAIMRFLPFIFLLCRKKGLDKSLKSVSKLWFLDLSWIWEIKGRGLGKGTIVPLHLSSNFLISIIKGLVQWRRMSKY